VPVCEAAFTATDNLHCGRTVASVPASASNFLISSIDFLIGFEFCPHAHGIRLRKAGVETSSM
jgi:hypothetical protein